MPVLEMLGMLHTRPRTHARLVRRFLPGALLLAVALSLAAGGCAPTERAPDREAQLASFDSLLADLGGPQTADLSRPQRWKLIASVGTGLPPESDRLEDLPEPGSRAVGLIQAYCLQCHGVASPRMHSADEWPILIRRMFMRAADLRYRLGGPRTATMVDSMLIAGLRTAQVPAAADVDTLVAYFERHSFPAATDAEIPDTPDAALYVEKCTACHDAPSPSAHPAAQLPALVARMSAMRAMLGMDQLTAEEQSRIVAFMQQSSR